MVSIKMKDELHRFPRMTVLPWLQFVRGESAGISVADLRLSLLSMKSLLGIFNEMPDVVGTALIGYFRRSIEQIEHMMIRLGYDPDEREKMREQL